MHLRQPGGMKPIGSAHFVVDRTHVVSDGGLTDAEIARYLTVTQMTEQEAQHVRFAPR